jgi:predicted NAD-dependent protein-ADP-ribosyltransferase YbiA (DUF1768 family)
MESIKWFRGRYEYLSNFYNCEVSIGGITFDNSEAAFQSFKTDNIKVRKQFVGLRASESKKKGRQVALVEGVGSKER